MASLSSRRCSSIFPYLLSHVLPVGQKSDWRLHLKRSSWATFSFSISWTTFPYPWPAPSTVSYFKFVPIPQSRLLLFISALPWAKKQTNQLVIVENKLLSPSAQQSLRLKVNGLSWKKKETRLFPEELKSLGGLDVWTKPDPWGKRNEHGKITSLGKIRPLFWWELQKFDTVPRKLRAKVYLTDHTTLGWWWWDSGLPEERVTSSLDCHPASWISDRALDKDYLHSISQLTLFCYFSHL